MKLCRLTNLFDCHHPSRADGWDTHENLFRKLKTDGVWNERERIKIFFDSEWRERNSGRLR